jgi:RNA polymerase sporulation-specific sigma factor
VIQDVKEIELIERIKANDEESLQELISAYQRIIWSIIYKCVHFPIPHDLDKQDLYQEALIGLMNAIKHHDPRFEVQFSSFASKCIENEVRSYLRKHRSQNRQMLNQAVSLDMHVSEDENLTLLDTISCSTKEFDPVFKSDIAWVKDQIPSIREHLSDTEWNVFQNYHLGYTYREIGKQFDLTDKDVDNTIQKIKKKIRLMFDTHRSL